MMIGKQAVAPSYAGIHTLAFTPVNVNDTGPADRLICGDEATVHADKAHDSNARRVRLKEMDIRFGGLPAKVGIARSPTSVHLYVAAVDPA